MLACCGNCYWSRVRKARQGPDSPWKSLVQEMAKSMRRHVSLSAIASILCSILAGVVYLAGWLEGERLVAASQGFEMAFYLSPLVFMAVDFLLVVGLGVGLVAMFRAPDRWRCLQGLSA